MYPMTKEERKERGVKYETIYTFSDTHKTDLEFYIYDKSGNVRSRLVLNEEDVRSLRDTFNKYLGEV